MATIYFVILWNFDQTKATQIILKWAEPGSCALLILLRVTNSKDSFTINTIHMTVTYSRLKMYILGVGALNILSCWQLKS